MKTATKKAPKRGYSRDFTPRGDTGKRYLLDEIPAGLWKDVKAKSKRTGISIRAKMLQHLAAWIAEPSETSYTIKAMVGEGWTMTLQRSPGYRQTDPRAIAAAFAAVSKALKP